MTPEDRWVRFYGTRQGIAVRIESGMRVRDLPNWFQPCLERHYNSLEPLRFRSGKFFFVQWKCPRGEDGQYRPSWWPEATETEVGPGDYLTANSDGGISYLQNYANMTPEDDR